MSRVECKAFQCDIAFDGAPALMQIRVFLRDGQVVGVRSFRLLGPPDEDGFRDKLKNYPATGQLSDAEYLREDNGMAPGPYSGTWP